MSDSGFQGLRFDAVTLPDAAEALRADVRAFLRSLPAGDHLPSSDFGTRGDPAFSRALGARGWIGMTWPAQYGGGGRTQFERFVVTEELLAAGAPVGCHWIADRQSGPLLLSHGTEAQRTEYLPRIVRGECFFSIGMSEPDSGSDLASVRTTAQPVEGGFVVNGTKLWTSGAHINHYMIALVRTETQGENRHAGLSQLIIDLKNAAGVTVRPIRNLAGEEEFNEVVFENCFVPHDNLVGELGNGWSQVTSELGYERSGPERFLSAFRIYVELVRALDDSASREQRAVLGRLAAHIMTLRQLSISVAGMLEQGRSPVTEAALIKELGNSFERVVPELVRQVAPRRAGALFRATLEDTLLHAPSFTLRGGTREILRGVIARGLGLR